MSTTNYIGHSSDETAVNPYESKSLEALARDYLNYKYITNEEEALQAVKKDGFLLRYVRFQTAKICSAAVNENYEAIMHVQPHIFEELEREMALKRLEHQFNQCFGGTAEQDELPNIS